MNESKWKEGVIRPAMKGEVLRHFGVFHIEHEYSVTHLATGFKGHHCQSASEARSVAEALEELPGWDDVKLSPDGKLEVVGMGEALFELAGATRKRVIAPPASSEQATLTTG